RGCRGGRPTARLHARRAAVLLASARRRDRPVRDGRHAVYVTDRRAELAANLAAVRDRIAAAARAAGRQPADLTLVAVTKTFPASDVALLAELGVADV